MRSIYQKLCLWIYNWGRMNVNDAHEMASLESIKQVDMEHHEGVAYIAVNGRRVCTFEIYANPESMYVDNLEEAREMWAHDYVEQMRREGKVRKEVIHEK